MRSFGTDRSRVLRGHSSIQSPEVPCRPGSLHRLLPANCVVQVRRKLRKPVKLRSVGSLIPPYRRHRSSRTSHSAFRRHQLFLRIHLLCTQEHRRRTPQDLRCHWMLHWRSVPNHIPPVQLIQRPAELSMWGVAGVTGGTRRGEGQGSEGGTAV